MNRLTDYLRTWAKSKPDQILYTFLDGKGYPVQSYTYASLEARTNGLAQVLASELRVKPGDPIVLAYPPGLEIIAAFFACVKVGALPAPVPPPSHLRQNAAYDRILLVAEDCGAALALTDQSLIGAMNKLPGASCIATQQSTRPTQTNLEWVATNELGTAPVEEFSDRSDTPLFLQYTSGSTQTPRGVLVSHQNVISNGLATVDHDGVGLSWIPHFHDLGLIGYYLFPLVKGATAHHFSSADFLRRPLLWLEAIGRYQVTFTSAPNFAFDYCLQEDKVPESALANLDLRSLRTMMNGSEPVRPDTMQRFLARFARCGLSERALSAAYGLAEHTLCASSGGRTHLRISRKSLDRNRVRVARDGNEKGAAAIASCGEPLRDVTVRIVNPLTREVKSAGDIGEIWLSSPGKALGYWKKSDLTRQIFHARIVRDPLDAEYLRTGDLGFMHEGQLYVCGRAKDIIIIRGVNIHPTDIEMTTERALPSAYRGRVVAFGSGPDAGTDDGLVILIAAKNRDPAIDLQSLFKELRKSVTVPIHAIATVSVSAIPRTSSGKLVRNRCRELWHQGGIDCIQCYRLPEPTSSGSAFSTYLDNLIGQDGSQDALTLEQLGLDSIEFVALSLEIERFLQEAGIAGEFANEAFDLRALQSLKIGDLKRINEELIAGNVHLAARLYQCGADAIASREAEAMRRDALLPSDIVLPRQLNVRNLNGRPTILLTGATGFLGSHLLATLLRRGEGRIVVLARGHDDDHAHRRVAQALSRTCNGNDVTSAPSRFEVLLGDISKPCFGLTEDRWSRLSSEVGSVFHCAAEVDYVKTYSELSAPNVFGTREILRFVAAGAPKRLHYISSTFIFGWSTLPRLFERDHNLHMKALDFGYAQTKWVAEQLVLKAIEKGFDARIYRPSLVTASQLGHYVWEDIVVRALGYMIRHELSVNAQNQISFLPVDVVANNIVALARLAQPAERVFHLTSDPYYTMEAACRSISERYGYEFDYVDIDTFVEHMNSHCNEADALFPLLAFFRNNSGKINRMRDKRYDNANYRGARVQSGVFQPEPALADTMGAIVEFLLDEQLIPPPPRQPDNRHGRSAL